MKLKLALTLLKRQRYNKALQLLMTALILAVTCISSISFFSERLLHAVNDQAAELLGADLVVNSAVPIPTAFIESAHRLECQTTQTLLFPSVLQRQQQFVLASIKAVNKGYPLRGELSIAIRDEILPRQAPPDPGTIWVAPSVLALLHAKVGDSVQLGAKNFKIVATLVREPDRTSHWFSVAPRVFMNSTDLAATQIIQPASRVRYQLMIKGSKEAITQLHEVLAPQLTLRQSLSRVSEGRPILRDVIKRVSHYVHLAALLNVLLAGIAIAMTVQHYTVEHYDTTALLRSLGLSRWTVLQIFAWQWVSLGGIATVIGCSLGWGLQLVLDACFASLINVQLPALSLKPIWIAIALTYALLLGFASPRLLQLGRVAPMRVLQRQLLPLPTSALGIYGMALAVLLAMCWWLTNNLNQSVMVLYSLVLFGLVVGSVTWLCLKSLVWLSPRKILSVRLGLQRLHRHSLSNVTHVICFAAVFAVLLVLTLIRHDLMHAWQAQLDPTAPNYFLINIQQDQRQAIEDFFTEQKLERSAIYAMIRGRLVERNEQPIAETLTPQQQQVRALHRELNLTWAQSLPAGNRITQGHWWDAQDSTPQISVEQGLAQRLGLALGDRLGFDLGGELIHATVTNFRDLRWDSMQPNFYVIFQPQQLQNQPATLLLSFYLPPGRETVLAQLLQRFPNISLIDMAMILQQVRDILNKITLALLYILMFSLSVGVLVLLAASLTTRAERQQENRLLQKLGAHQGLIRSIARVEWSCLNFLSTLLAVMGASLMAALAADRLLGIPFHFNLWIWLLPPILAIIPFIIPKNLLSSLRGGA